jgi:hypothetical protein
LPNGPLSHASREVVHRPDLEPAAYQRALRQAELACRLVPQDASFLTTLGAAQYRVGHDQEAVATLTLADQILAQIGGPSTETLALLALAQHRLGKPAEARTTLRRMHEIVNRPGWPLPDWSLPLLHGIEALEQDLAFPADPFAP